MDRKRKVLFVCTGNSARSQMAEALLRKHAGDRFEVHSAGLEPSVLNPYTLRVMEEAGYDMSNHSAKSVREYLGKEQFTYVVSVCFKTEERCPTSFLGELHRLHWPFDDPAALEGSDKDKTAFFREIRDQIEAKVQSWLKELDVAHHLAE